LVDDLEETERVDDKYNESSFQLAKVLPTNFHRTCTIGGASTWNLIMCAWSYENNLAIPIPDTEEIGEDIDISIEAIKDNTSDVIDTSSTFNPEENPDGYNSVTPVYNGDVVKPKKNSFVGGLTRVFKVGYFKRIAKLDFSGLYPSIMLTRGIFPEVDTTDILKRLLLYFKQTRDEFKYLAGDDSPLPKEKRGFYELKQAPLKVLNNSLFGALGSGKVFKWGDQILAEEVTCCGRLYLRNLFMYMKDYGCDILLVVTDGVNLSYPVKYYKNINGEKVEEPIDIDDLIYINKGGKEFKGLRAIVEKFNEEELTGFLKVDYDKEWKATLNVARNNYVNLTKDDKIKIVGATIKSNVMPEYVEEFINNGLKLIMEDKPSDFVEYYYDYLGKIYNKKIPLKKIASKANIKQTIDSYKNRGKDKNGREKGKQAHMELLMCEGVDAKVGETVYYINIGTAKSHGDTKVLIDKITKQEYIASKLILKEELEKNPELLGEYNIAKYVDAFNSRVTNLLVGFSERVKTTLLQTNPTNRQYYTDSELQLTNYDNDSIEEAITMSSDEVKFWNTTKLDPRIVWDGFKNTDTLWYENDDIITSVESNDNNVGDVDNIDSYHIIWEKLNNMPGFKDMGRNIRKNTGTFKEKDIVLVQEGDKYSIKFYSGNTLNTIKTMSDEYIRNILNNLEKV
jgi:hypothetical protein